MAPSSPGWPQRPCRRACRTGRWPGRSRPPGAARPRPPRPRGCPGRIRRMACARSRHSNVRSSAASWTTAAKSTGRGTAWRRAALQGGEHEQFVHQARHRLQLALHAVEPRPGGVARLAPRQAERHAEPSQRRLDLVADVADEALLGLMLAATGRPCGRTHVRGPRPRRAARPGTCRHGRQGRRRRRRRRRRGCARWAGRGSGARKKLTTPQVSSSTSGSSVHHDAGSTPRMRGRGARWRSGIRARPRRAHPEPEPR